MKNYLLDSFALLCWLQDEKGADKVDRILQDAQDRKIVILMNIVNIGEVYYRIAKVEGNEKADRLLDEIRLLPIKIISCRDELVIEAAKIKAKYQVAYANAFAVATARESNATILSRDPELHEVERIVNIEWL